MKKSLTIVARLVLIYVALMIVHAILESFALTTTGQSLTAFVGGSVATFLLLEYLDRAYDERQALKKLLAEG
ncbi:hypothetical protein [Cupriavidus sp. RAF12]|uniref:hypothetical protein n=1 Tax=Cupriavidus sp. RAF12 TaxID=3233050 RepID=UPI003F91EBD7